MKIRQGFVSNSSTSSFICDICGGVEAGMDISLSECEMVKCADGHTFHNDCLDAESKKVLSELREKGLDSCYDIDISFCPVCQLRVLTEKDAKKYLNKALGISDKIVLEDIKKSLGTYEAFSKRMSENKS